MFDLARTAKSWACSADKRVVPRILAALGCGLLLHACAPARTPPPAGQQLATLVGYVAAPVVLVTATAVLLATLASKHATAGSLLRALTAEWRHAATPPTRRECVRAQVTAFTRRVRVLWMATVCMYMAAISFLITTLEVMFSPYWPILTRFGIVTLPLGVLLLLFGIVLTLEDIRISRHTLSAEISDVVENSPRETSWGTQIEH